MCLVNAFRLQTQKHVGKITVSPSGKKEHHILELPWDVEEHHIYPSVSSVL